MFPSTVLFHLHGRARAVLEVKPENCLYLLEVMETGEQVKLTRLCKFNYMSSLCPELLNIPLPAL